MQHGVVDLPGLEEIQEQDVDGAALPADLDDVPLVNLVGGGERGDVRVISRPERVAHTDAGHIGEVTLERVLLDAEAVVGRHRRPVHALGPVANPGEQRRRGPAQEAARVDDRALAAGMVARQRVQQRLLLRREHRGHRAEPPPEPPDRASSCA